MQAVVQDALCNGLFFIKKYEQIFGNILTKQNICAMIYTNVARKFSRKGGIIGQLQSIK